MQRNKQVAMGRKKFNMDPKKVGGGGPGVYRVTTFPSLFPSLAEPGARAVPRGSGCPQKPWALSLALPKREAEEWVTPGTLSSG